jgi:SAM-dependent methyltransferase
MTLSKIIRKSFRVSSSLGFDPRKPWSLVRNLPWYLSDYRKLKAQSAASEFKFPFGRPFPCLTEKNDQSGSALSHYFLQDLHVARRIHELNPERHVDVGSRIDGFVAHVASFRKIEVFDIRPLDTPIPGVTFRRADLMQLDESLIECTDSLSCLHTIEHFGLGRYGDPVDFDGFHKGLENLKRILKPGGTFHFSTPMGPQRIEFNAHRIFSARFLIDYFSKNYVIERFSYLDQEPYVHENRALDDPGIDSNFGCRYGCAILELTKK